MTEKLLILDFLKVFITIKRPEGRWEGVGHWELPDTTVGMNGFYVCIRSAVASSAKLAGVPWEGRDWSVLIEIVRLSGTKAEEVRGIHRASPPDSHHQFAWNWFLTTSAKRGRKKNG